jgi:hypothetical protein
VVHLAATGGLALATRSIADSAASPHDAAQPGVQHARDSAASSGGEDEAAAAALGGQLAGLSLGQGQPQKGSSFDDPLRRPAAEPAPGGAAAEGPGERRSSGGSSRPGGAARSGAGGHDSSGAAAAGGLQLFTGFVSFEQLEDAMGTR